MNIRAAILPALLLSTAGLPAALPAYRDFVAPDAVQSDLHGAVKSVHEREFEISDDGGRTLTSETVRSFDGAGYILEETETDHEEGKKTVTRYSYDASGALTQEEETKSGEPVVVRKIRLVPDRRRLIKEIVAKDGRARVVSEMTYDQFRKEGNGRDFRMDGQVEVQYATKRDQNGKETEVTFSDGQGRATDILKITWDARGFPIREESDSKAQKYLAVSTYEYPAVDSQGNWTEQHSSTIFKEKGRTLGPSRTVVTRTIDYY